MRVGLSLGGGGATHFAAMHLGSADIAIAKAVKSKPGVPRLAGGVFIVDEKDQHEPQPAVAHNWEEASFSDRFVLDQLDELEYCLTDVVTHEKCILSKGVFNVFIDEDTDYMSIVGSVDGQPVNHELQDLFSHILWEDAATGCLRLFVWQFVFATFPKTV